MPNKKNPYGEFKNFNNRLNIETTFGPGDVRDHRDGFAQREYRRNQQDESENKEPMAGLPPMKSVTEPPKPKAGVKNPRKRTPKTDDAALDAAHTKDLKTRNLK